MVFRIKKRFSPEYRPERYIKTQFLEVTLTNRLNFNLTGALVNVEDNIDNNGNDDWDKNLKLGLTYRLK
jgi:hypothetical protein